MFIRFGIREVVGIHTQGQRLDGLVGVMDGVDGCSQQFGYRPGKVGVSSFVGDDDDDDDGCSESDRDCIGTIIYALYLGIFVFVFSFPHLRLYVGFYPSSSLSSDGRE